MTRAKLMQVFFFGSIALAGAIAFSVNGEFMAMDLLNGALLGTLLMMFVFFG